MKAMKAPFTARAMATHRQASKFAHVISMIGVATLDCRMTCAELACALLQEQLGSMASFLQYLHSVDTRQPLV